MADPSMILICLVCSPYPFFAPRSSRLALLCAAAGLVLAGAAVESFLLRRGKKALLFPALCAGAEVILEVLYQLNQFHIIHTMRGHAIWEYVLFGVVVLYVLLGTLLGWLFSRACGRFRREGRAV